MSKDAYVGVNTNGIHFPEARGSKGIAIDYLYIFYSLQILVIIRL